MGLETFIEYEHNNAPLLEPQMSTKVLKFAEKRLKKSGAAKDMEAKVAKLTVEDVNKAIRKYLKPYDQWSVVNAGDYKENPGSR